MTLAAIGATVILLILRPGAAAPDRTTLRDSLRAMRTASDSCLAAVDSATSGLRAYRTRLDSMRQRVHALEDADAGGVPVDSYDVYLGAFERYNDSVAAWGGREDTLRARDERCRDVVQAHNRLADSLRRALPDGP